MAEKKSNKGIALDLDIRDFSLGSGKREDILQGEQEDYVTTTVVTLPLETNMLEAGKYTVWLENENVGKYEKVLVEIYIEHVQKLEDDPIAQNLKEFSFGGNNGLPAISGISVTDNRGKYPSVIAKVIFPYRIASWVDPSTKNGIKTVDYEKVKIAGTPPNEEKILIIKVINRFLAQNDIKKTIVYDDITAFLEVYYEKGSANQKLVITHALTSTSAYRKVAEEIYLSGFEREAIKSEIEIFNRVHEETDIADEEGLLKYVQELLDKVLIHHIENRRWIDAFWEGDRKIKVNEKTIKVPRSPKNEIQIQPTLHVIFELGLKNSGVQVIRESFEGVGALDFRFLYTTKSGLPLTIPLEFKLAHHGQIEKGLNRQLPAYMKALNVKSGIYSILWFKDEFGKFYSKPSNRTIREMNEWLLALAKEIEEKEKIKIEIKMIDASVKPTASNL